MIHLLFSAWAVIGSPAAWASLEHDDYSKLFKTHAEFCSLSQIKPVAGKEGGPGGHATLYIEGLCKDYSVAYPRVVPCGKANNPPEFAHTGVGISVDNDFRNINWSAVPDYDLFTHGITPNIERVDVLAKNAVIASATAKRVYQGVVFNPDLVGSDIKKTGYQEQVAGITIGTDIAIQFGRNMECIRFPIPPAKLQGMADYLNSRNEPYVTGKKVYDWSGFHNNCAMLAADVLAAALIRSEIVMDQAWFEQIFDIGLPRNGLSELQDIIHYGGRNRFQVWRDHDEYAGMDYRTLHNDSLRWKSLVTVGSVPTGFGGISQRFPIYSENELYKGDLKNVYILSKKFGLYTLSTRAFDEPPFTDLKESAKYWLAIYQRALKDSQSRKRSKDRSLYEAFMEREIARVHASGLIPSAP